MTDVSSSVLIQTLASGLLWGFVYALIALGLTVIFGVMDIVNFAHGDFLMISMFVAYIFNTSLFGLSALASLPLNALVLFVFGVIIYKILIKPVLTAPPLAQIFSTFGLLVFLRGAAQFIFSADYKTLEHLNFQGRVDLFGIFLSKPQMVAAVGAIVMFVAFYLFITKTKTGWALLAVAENKQAAALMGIDSDRMYALAWGLGAACVGVAGALLANFYYVFPEVGAVFGFLAFVTVALGGFGSIQGAFWAGLIIGITEALAGTFIAPSLKYLVVFSIYLLVVLIRPRGLMGHTS
ncbi:MAG: branched-chain amino acid ABC transporter permease [Negativicutes bacterium]|nr:branched-chain amino acid ABC transporter permease [Negativicutes bacterium]MDR3592819.1 branched-chain amino acid ABC transporter permease [Negativicutes bacterium]